jgi:hypothetical protein
MSDELVKEEDTREYVSFIMGCDLHEHAIDLRKIVAAKAQYVSVLHSHAYAPASATALLYSAVSGSCRCPALHSHVHVCVVFPV